jgi:kinesin family member 2/24
MDSFIFENRDFIATRIRQLEISSKSPPSVDIYNGSAEVTDTAVCVRIRPITENEVEQGHIQGVLSGNSWTANIYEPRRKVRGKPEINVYDLPACDIICENQKVGSLTRTIRKPHLL